MILVGCPFAFCFLLGLFWIFYKFYSKQKIIVILESFLITVSITFFFFQSSVLNALANLLNCSKIENNFYLTNYLLEKCAENEYYEKWRNFVIFPSFSFFSLILILLPMIYMFKNINNLYSDNVLRKVGFLLNGYSPRYFFWYIHLIYFFINMFYQGVCFSFQKNHDNSNYFLGENWGRTNYLPE